MTGYRTRRATVADIAHDRAGDRAGELRTDEDSVQKISRSDDDLGFQSPQVCGKGRRMLWLIVLALIAVMLFVMFHKPAVNTSTVGWTPPAPAPRPTSSAASPTADTTTEAAPATVETFNFNDLYAAPRSTNQDQPRA